MAKAKVIMYSSKKLSNGERPLMLRITKGSTRKYSAIGYSVLESEWNKKTGKPKGRSVKSKQLARIIEDIELKALMIIQKLNAENKHFTADDIISALHSRDKDHYVFSFWQNLINKLIETGKQGNSNAYKNTLGVFKKYRKNKDLPFASLNYKEILKFEEYLMTNGLATNGIAFHMRTLRAMYNKAIDQDFATKENYPFEKYKIKRESTRHRALTKEEIKRIRDIEVNDKSIEKARNLFMFSFYTRGMSFIDIVYLKADNLYNDRIHYKRAKTGQLFTIKLTPEAKAIIDKYSETPKETGFLFPIIQSESNKYKEYKNAMRLTNKKLKILGDLAEISIPLTTYVARHSWATIAKRGGVATSVISEGLGHTTENTTQVYLDSFENDVLDDANDFITRLE